MTDLLTLRYLPISQAALFDGNAKLHDLDKIIQSIKKYGFKSPPKWEGTLNNRRGGIVAGNGRVEALRVMEERGDDLPIGIAQSETGEWCVPVLFGVEASSEATARAYALDDNNLTVLGGNFDVADLLGLYDQDLLMSELEDLARLGEESVTFDNDFVENILQRLLTETKSVDNKEDENGLGKEEEDEPVSPEGIQVREGVELGSIWALGRHRIMCGDSTIESNVRELLGNQFDDVGMVFSDAPYGVEIVSGKGSNGTVGGSKPFGSKETKQGGKIIKANEYAAIIGDNAIETAQKSFEICKYFTDAIQIWWGANYYDFLPPSPCWIVWDKENTGDFADAELAWNNHKSSVRIFKHMWNGMIKASERGEKRVHPTQKPVELFVWCAEKYGKPEDIVFDPFLGSGISIIGCEKMKDNRTVYGMELSPEYIEVILQRFTKFTGIEPILVKRLISR